MKPILLILATLLLVVAACGGTDVTTTTQDPNADLRVYVAAVMATEADEDEIPIDDDEAACIAETTFDKLGADRFLELGFDAGSATTQAMATFDDRWTDAEWETLIDALFGCADVKQKMADSFLASGADATVAACVSEGYFESGELRNGMISRADDDSAQASLLALNALIQECSAG